MKKISIFSICLSALLAVFVLTSFYMAKKDQVRHVVVFKYKQDASEEKINQVTEAFGALKGKIPGIVDFEYGVNDSPEGKNLGFTHVYLLTFKDAQARDEYLPHPEHKKFGELLGKLGVLEDAFVVDYSPVK
jgi:hypothetical protein